MRAGMFLFHCSVPFRSERGTRVKRLPSPTLMPTPSSALNTVANSSSPHSKTSSNALPATALSQCLMFPV